jgi:hypothetical protein
MRRPGDTHVVWRPPEAGGPLLFILTEFLQYIGKDELWVAVQQYDLFQSPHQLLLPPEREEPNGPG